MAVAEKISALKLILGQQQSPSAKQYLAAPQLGSDVVARGAVVELLGGFKIEWLCHLLAMHPQLKIFWVDRHQTVLPTALHQRGVHLSQITFALLKDDFVQPLRRAIQSQVFSIVIAPQVFQDIKILQAFQLFTEKANCTLFLLAKEKPSQAWPISLQMQIDKHPDEDFTIEILKQRYGRSI